MAVEAFYKFAAVDEGGVRGREGVLEDGTEEGGGGDVQAYG